MRKFITKYLSNSGKVLDVGSMNINGSYRDFFNNGWEYTGLDIKYGNGVDLVVKDQYNWDELKDETFDAVISGQALEHIEDDKAVMSEICRVLKYGGFCCVIAPSAGVKHSEPDYRRYTVESMEELLKTCDFTILESYIDATSQKQPWFDVVAIAKKNIKCGSIE